MRHLQDYILEKQNDGSENSKTIIFDFEGLENAEDTLKSLEGIDGVEISEKTVTVTVNADNVDNLDKLQDIVQQFYDTEHGSAKRTNDPKYGELVKSFGENVSKLNDAIDEIKNPDDGDDDDDDDDDHKEAE